MDSSQFIQIRNPFYKIFMGAYKLYTNVYKKTIYLLAKGAII